MGWKQNLNEKLQQLHFQDGDLPMLLILFGDSKIAEVIPVSLFSEQLCFLYIKKNVCGLYNAKKNHICNICTESLNYGLTPL